MFSLLVIKSGSNYYDVIYEWPLTGGSCFIFQGLVDLLEPFFLPAIDELLSDVEAGRTWTLHHVPEAISKMMANLEDLATLIPKSFYCVRTILEDFILAKIKLKNKIIKQDLLRNQNFKCWT